MERARECWLGSTAFVGQPQRLFSGITFHYVSLPAPSASGLRVRRGQKSGNSEATETLCGDVFLGLRPGAMLICAGMAGGRKAG